MPATEEKMGEGSFSLEFLPTTPTWILDRLDPRNEAGLGGVGFAQLYVTRQWLPVGKVPSATLRGSLARYGGIIYKMGEDRLTIEGSGPLSLLGGEGDGGTIKRPPTATPSTTFDGHLDSQVGLATADANGLTRGVTDGAAGPFTLRMQGGTTRRQVLDTMITQTVATAREYVVKPNGVVTVRTPANLWDSGLVVLSADGVDWGAPGKRSVKADLSLTELGVDDWTSRVVVDWDNTVNYGMANLTPPAGYRNMAGGPIEWETYIDWTPKGRIRGKATLDKIVAWLANSQAAANNVAAGELARRNKYRINVTAEIDTYDPWSLGKPGDSWYVYDNRLRLKDLTNFVALNGRQVGARLFQVASWTVPFRAGYGYYVYAWSVSLGAMELVDITQWVVPEDSMVSVELGSRSRHSKRKPRLRRGGYQWPRGVPWRRRRYGRRVQPYGTNG